METQKYTIDELVKEFCNSKAYIAGVKMYDITSWPLQENVVALPVKRVEFDEPKFVRYHAAKPAEVRQLLEQAGQGTVVDFGNPDVMLQKEGKEWLAVSCQTIEMKLDDAAAVRSWFEDPPDFNIY